MATEDNPRFAREKVRPGVAYLKGKAYKDRFGIDYGRWLVVTTSHTRLEKMKFQTERAGGRDLFYFTTFELVSPHTIFYSRSWLLAGYEEYCGLTDENLQTGILPEAKIDDFICLD